MIPITHAHQSPLGQYIVAYKQAHVSTAAWFRQSDWHFYPLAETAAKLLQYKAYIVQVAVFELANWNYGKPTGDPLYRWEREQEGASQK